MSKTLRFFLIALFFPIFLGAQEDALVLASRGERAMLLEDWYEASTYFTEALRINSSFLTARKGMARVSYELGEYEQSLHHSFLARKLAPTDSEIISLEVFSHIALGDKKSAHVLLDALLKREPYNRDAMFAKAELDILEGRPSQASFIYRDLTERYPDDKRALISLALISLPMGNIDMALDYIQRALIQHPDDASVYYYAAWLDSQNGNFNRSILRLKQALSIKPDYIKAKQLLATSLYKNGLWAESIALADELIALNRSGTNAWYIKAMALNQLKKYEEARRVLKTALAMSPEDEFLRLAIENSLLEHSKLELPERKEYANWHFERAQNFRQKNLIDQARYEYQRGLHLDPYSPQRAHYAELLGSMGYPSLQLEELIFMQDIEISNTYINDTVESYNSLLSDSLHRQWGVEPIHIPQENWKIALFVIDSVYNSVHVDAPQLGLILLKDLLRQSPGYEILELPHTQESFSRAWRLARESGADYFIIYNSSESDLDFSLQTDLYSARSGELIRTFQSYQTGMDKLRNSNRKILENIVQSIPFRASVLQRQGNEAIVSAGRIRGLKKGDKLIAISQGRVETDIHSLAIKYDEKDLVAFLVVEELDDYVSLVRVQRNGFFDRLINKDPVFLADVEQNPAKKQGNTDIPFIPAEIRSLIRSAR